MGLPRRDQKFASSLALLIQPGYTTLDKLVGQRAGLRRTAAEADNIHVDLLVGVLIVEGHDGVVGLLDAFLAT